MFSCTVSARTSPRSWNVRAVPSELRIAAGRCTSCTPRNRIEPVTGASPDTALKNVDLPAPLAPISPTISPRRTSSDTPSSAVTPPYSTRTSSASSNAGTGMRNESGRTTAGNAATSAAPCSTTRGRGSGRTAPRPPTSRSSSAPTARYRPPIPSGATTTATTSNAADAIGTTRSARKSVNGIVEMNCGRPFTITAAVTMPAQDPVPPTTRIATSCSDSNNRNGSLALIEPAFSANSAPPSPTIAPDNAYASSLYGPGSTPNTRDRSRMSRTARNDRPAFVTAIRPRTTNTTPSNVNANTYIRMSLSRKPGRSQVRPAAVTSLRVNKNTSANCWNASVVIATCRPRIRSDGSPAIVAAAAVTATATRIATGHAAPRLPTLIAVNAPTPRNAACASDNSPVRATSTSNPSAAIAVTITPTRMDSFTSPSANDHAIAAATSTHDAIRDGRARITSHLRCRATLAGARPACRSPAAGPRARRGPAS